MRSAEMKLARLSAPAFLAALLVLIANDFFLKAAYHNWLTGKLSDFAGLFAWGFFWCVVLPARIERPALWASAAAFVVWKSPAADGLIAWLNAATPFAIARVVDPTDLAALVMLPLAAYAARHARALTDSRLAKTAATLASAFAFAATYVVPNVAVRPKNVEFEVPRSQVDLVAELDRRGYFPPDADPLARGPMAEQYDFKVKDWECGTVGGRIEVGEREGHAVIRLRELYGSSLCFENPNAVDDQAVRDRFQDYVVKPLENWARSADSAFVRAPELRLSEVIGCYEVELGSWQPRPDMWTRARLKVIPRHVQLTDSLGSRLFEGYAGRRTVQGSRRHAATLWWEPLAGDSIRIAGTWRGQNGVEVRVPRLATDSVAVLAQTFSDRGDPRFTAPATVRRTGCSR